jgi:hypothetical protein
VSPEAATFAGAVAGRANLTRIVGVASAGAAQPSAAAATAAAEAMRIDGFSSFFLSTTP